MKRPLVILILGIVLGAAAGLGVFRQQTAGLRAMMARERPELAWLQKEFRLSDEELQGIERLHQAYLPQCAEFCARIEAIHQDLRRLLEEQGRFTAEMEALLKRAADLRVSCQKNMLEHFVEVSRIMPPDQRRRYLSWVQGKTIVMPHESRAGAPLDSGHSHGH